MGIWAKREIQTEHGRELATLPVIVSASRATDIPAFYSRWFIERFRRGYAVKFNPFSGRREVVSFEKTRVFVFWTKYPAPMIKYLDELEASGINYYFLYTLNDYPEYELHVPGLDLRIDVFRRLADKIGPERVLWRYDPLIISDRVSQEALIARVEHIGQMLKGYTQRLIFSFVDLGYRKVIRNLKRYGANFYNIGEQAQRNIVERLKEMASVWDMELRSCASKVDFTDIGVRPNKCIDDELMVRLFSQDKDLMNFLGYEGQGQYISRKKLKDRGQRAECSCVYSKDLGRYDTCPFECIYCYANSTFDRARENFKKHNYLNDSL